FRGLLGFHLRRQDRILALHPRRDRGVRFHMNPPRQFSQHLGRVEGVETIADADIPGAVSASRTPHGTAQLLGLRQKLLVAARGPLRRRALLPALAPPARAVSGSPGALPPRVARVETRPPAPPLAVIGLLGLHRCIASRCPSPNRSLTSPLS